jgi:hypothetical protein
MFKRKRTTNGKKQWKFKWWWWCKMS